MRAKVASILTALLLVPVTSSFASTVEVSFSGTLDISDIPGLLVGTSFSGDFIYDTNAPIVATLANVQRFALNTGALSLTVGSDVLANTNGNALFPDTVDVTTFVTLGNFEVVGVTMAGTGPVNGGSAFVFFEDSADPAILAQALPFPFPTDFQTFSLLLVAPGFDGPAARGDITSFSVVNTATEVPEPDVLTLFTSGLAALGLLRRRTRHLGQD